MCILLLPAECLIMTCSCWLKECMYIMWCCVCCTGFAMIAI